MLLSIPGFTIFVLAVIGKYAIITTCIGMKEAEIKTIIFVYNARSGIVNAVLDTAHKILTPATYSCRLCDITYGLTGEKKLWKQFRQRSSMPMKFLHKDQFLAEYKGKWLEKYTFPIVLAETSDTLEVLISTMSLNTMKNTEELIESIEKYTRE